MGQHIPITDLKHCGCHCFSEPALSLEMYTDPIVIFCRHSVHPLCVCVCVGGGGGGWVSGCGCGCGCVRYNECPH